MPTICQVAVVALVSLQTLCSTGLTQCSGYTLQYRHCSHADDRRADCAGMTIKFFALFFIQMCAMQPVYVSLLAVFTPLGVSIAALLGQPLSKRCGLFSTQAVATDPVKKFLHSLYSHHNCVAMAAAMQCCTYLHV